MREVLKASVRRVGELAEPVCANEPASKPIPSGPLFTIPGDDLTYTWECIPAY
jgi:hypothetical protein